MCNIPKFIPRQHNLKDQFVLQESTDQVIMIKLFHLSQKFQGDLWCRLLKEVPPNTHHQDWYTLGSWWTLHKAVKVKKALHYCVFEKGDTHSFTNLLQKVSHILTVPYQSIAISFLSRKINSSIFLSCKAKYGLLKESK